MVFLRNRKSEGRSSRHRLHFVESCNFSFLEEHFFQRKKNTCTRLRFVTLEPDEVGCELKGVWKIKVLIFEGIIRILKQFSYIFFSLLKIRMMPAYVFLSLPWKILINSSEEWFEVLNSWGSRFLKMRTFPGKSLTFPTFLAFCFVRTITGKKLWWLWLKSELKKIIVQFFKLQLYERTSLSFCT